MALEMVENQKPDSAITILNSINQTKLSDQDLSIYSLVYTMAQNKAGQNVDHDSLIRTAYNWYKDRPNDSLYAKCLYYMGLYYAHNDSSEKALNLFAKCVKYSRQQGDTLTYCLGLFQSSRLLRLYDADRAIGYARQVVDIYNKVNVSTANRVYSLLNLAESLPTRRTPSKRSWASHVKPFPLPKPSEPTRRPSPMLIKISQCFIACMGKKPMCCKRQKRLTTYV